MEDIADVRIRHLRDLVQTEKDSRIAKFNQEQTDPSQVPPKCRVIVVGVDASEFSRHAVEWARQNEFITTGDIVVLATIWEEALENYITTVDMGVYAGLVSLNHAEIRQQNDEAVDSARQMLKQFYSTYLSDCDVFPLIVSSNNIAKPSIGDILCRTAKTLGATAIVVGSYGHGSWKQFFLGSVSQYVVQNASCPVLVIKR